jgi:hypothetical protein
MQRQLHELTKEELIAVVQDYQEMVSELEELSHSLMTTEAKAGFVYGDAINDILYKERPGWRIHDKEKHETA